MASDFAIEAAIGALTGVDLSASAVRRHPVDRGSSPSAAQAGPVDSRGVNLVGVGDPDSVLAPDFMTAESTLLALSTGAFVPGAGPSSGLPAAQADATSSGGSASPGSGGDAVGAAVTQTDGYSIQESTSSASGGGAAAGTAPVAADGDAGGEFVAIVSGGERPTGLADTQSGGDAHADSIVSFSGAGSTVNSIAAQSGTGVGSANSGNVTVSVTGTEADVQFNGASGQQTASAGPTISLSTPQSGAQITRDGYEWNATVGNPLTITIGFRTVAPSYTVGGEDVVGTFTPFTAAEQAAATAAIGFWASIANITVVNLGNSDSAAIEFGNYSSSTDGSEAFTFLPFPPGNTAAASSQGDVFVNTHFASTTTVGDAPLGYVFVSMIHEIGHALGLEHPSNYNAGAGSISYANNASYIQDDRQYTVMSYFSETNTGANYSGKYPETPMLDDVAAIQLLYGANMGTAAGDTTYGFNSNAGSVYSITSPAQAVVFNVWDAGGTDTFDFSGYSQNQTINLNAESFSSVGGLTSNVSISLGVTIENAIGGLGNDTIIGNSADNVLTGGPGNDSIDGGAGTDTAVFHGARSAYSITRAGPSIQVSGPDGTDLLTNVELLKFDDQTVNANSIVNHPPTISAATTSFRPNQTVAASTIFSATDSDGDTIAQYKVTDTTVGGAYLVLDGVTQADNTTLTVTAAQLAQLQIVTPGTAQAANAFTVQAFDGTDWSTPTTINVATTESASVVSVTGSVLLSPVTWYNFNLSNLPFTVTDADGDPIVTYRFTDLGTDANGSFFAIGFTNYAQGATVDVSAAQIDDFWIKGGVGSGADSFQVQVYDGYLWSPVQTVTVITDTAPVVSASSTGIGLGQTKAASSIFGVFDANGDAMTQYSITDATVGGAHLLLNGVTQAENTPVIVTAANLSQLQITGASSANVNTFTVQAFDGYVWSAPTNIDVTSMAPNSPSVVTVTGSILLAPGKWFNFSTANLPISVTDADGDPIVTYRFTDVSAGAPSAYLQLNNINLAQGGTVDVAAAQLSNLWIKAATGTETDTIQVQVYDGYSWSTAQNISIVTHGANNAPVVLAATTSFGLNQTAAASTIFSVTDADGDPMTQYRITDTTAGGSSLLLNGVAQLVNTPVTVTAANLSQLQIQTASSHSVDTFAVQAYDGFDWSAAAFINVAAAAADTPSVITVTGSVLLGPGKWLQFNTSSLPISVTDADGDPIVAYRFTDAGAGAGSSYLQFNNINVAQGGTVDVAAAQLPNLWIKAASTNAVETLQIQVFDGIAWSVAQSVSIVTHGANHAPQVSAATTAFEFDQTFAASTIFSVADADGDPMTQYTITDTTAGGSVLLLNGVAQAVNTPITVTAANLSQLQVQSSSTSSVDTFTVKAYDGYDWSAATPINVVAMASLGSGPNTPSDITVTGPVLLSPGKWMQFNTSNLPISVTDADGDPIVTYRFSDASTGASSAYLQLDNANIPQGGTVDVPGAQLSDLWIKAATGNETDTLTVQVFDGVIWSDAENVSVITHGANHAPVVSAATTSFGLSQTVAASTIFSVTDADGDPMTQYMITDTTAGGSGLLLNGVTQAVNTPVTVTAANLSQLQIQTASSHSVDAFSVQAYDGFDWSAAASINVAASAADTASVITVNAPLLLGPGKWLPFSASALPISVTDADGDPIVAYRFTDVSTGADSSYLQFNNVNVAQGGTIDVAAAQLSGLWLKGAAGEETDTLQVQVYDGFGWSAAQDISVVMRSVEHLPIVSAATTSLDAGQTVAASSIFSVTDADGDAMTQYSITDVTVGGAHLLLNGVTQPETTPVTVTAAALSQLQIQTSSVSHDLNVFLVSANDGFGWSTPTSIGIVSGNTSSVETVTGALQLTPSQWFNFNTSSLPVSVTDADGDAPLTYRFTDVGAGATSAQLQFNNVNVAQGGTIDVAANQLSGLWLHGGSTTGIDTVRVQVNDGFAWSAPVDVSALTNQNLAGQLSNIVTGAIAGATNLLSGTTGNDSFVFAPNFGHDTITNYTPGQDALAIDHSIFANAAAALLATSDDAQGNAVIHADANDTITLQGVSTLALTLHLTDFHIV